MKTSDTAARDAAIAARRERYRRPYLFRAALGAPRPDEVPKRQQDAAAQRDVGGAENQP